jgi:hypothetical protein
MNSILSLDLTRVPRELKLIIEILKSKNDIKLNEIIRESIINTDWNLFIDLAMHHRIYPLLYSKLKKNDSVPSFVLQILSKHYKRNTFQMLQLCKEMTDVSKILIEHEVRSIFLKGPVLAGELYQDISHRTSCDLDVLVPIDQLEKVNELLRMRGYTEDEYISTVLGDWKWRHHHRTYFHSQKNIKLEIHWRLNPGPAKEPNFNELWERKEKSKLTNYPVYHLGREDLFLFLVSHGARHGWSRIRWLVDIHQIIEKDINWNELMELLKRNYYLHSAGQAIVLTTELFNNPLDRRLLKLYKSSHSWKLAQKAIFYLERMVNLHTDPVPEEVATYHKQHLLSLMSFPQKLLFILSFLYPYPEDAETLPLPKKIHVLYFPLRPFLWAWRKSRKHALP